MFDALPGVGLLPEPPLDIVEDLRVRGVVLVEDVLELEVRRPQAVAEVLCEDPAAVYGDPPSVRLSNAQND
jgi:hypothetical protein